MTFRTDRHNNPTAFTTDVAREAGLTLGVEYEVGEAFQQNSSLHTARLLGDPISITIKVIDKISYYTKIGQPRWIYIAIPHFIWIGLKYEIKKDIIYFHYQHEGGTELTKLFIKDIQIAVGDSLDFKDKVG